MVVGNESAGNPPETAAFSERDIGRERGSSVVPPRVIIRRIRPSGWGLVYEDTTVRYFTTATSIITTTVATYLGVRHKGLLKTPKPLQKSNS